MTAPATNHPTNETALLTGAPACPKCGGRMWDNRATKRNPKAPDFKCRDRSCDGVLWPGQHKAAVPILTPRVAPETAPAPAPASAPPGNRVGQGSTPPAASPARRTLRACYLDLTDFVLNQVRPKYEAAGLPCTDTTVAAITAALFIAVCKGESGGRA